MGDHWEIGSKVSAVPEKVFAMGIAPPWGWTRAGDPAGNCRSPKALEKELSWSKGAMQLGFGDVGTWDG